MVYRCIYLANIFPFHSHYLIKKYSLRFFLGEGGGNKITRNQSFTRNTSFSYKATTEMLQMPDFVAMHRVLQNFYRRILINNESILNFTLIRYSMLRVYPLN